MANLLLIGMHFYDYEEAIMKQIERLGYSLYYYYDKESFIISHFPFVSPKIGEKEVFHNQ